MWRRGRAVLPLSVILMLAGCSTGNQSVSDPPATGAIDQTPRQSTGCPSLATTPGHGVVVEYVDFIQANGTHYVVAENFGLTPVTATAGDIGDTQFLVRCALSKLNEQTHEAPPSPRDGDAAYVPEGTPVHAVKGWPTSCRLAAQYDGKWHVYLATDPHSSTGKPQPCADTTA